MAASTIQNDMALRGYPLSRQNPRPTSQPRPLRLHDCESVPLYSNASPCDGKVNDANKTDTDCYCCCRNSAEWTVLLFASPAGRTDSLISGHSSGTRPGNAVRNAIGLRVLTLARPTQKRDRLLFRTLSPPYDRQPMGNLPAPFHSALAFGSSIPGLCRARFSTTLPAGTSLRPAPDPHPGIPVVAFRLVGSFAGT